MGAPARRPGDREHELAGSSGMSPAIEIAASAMSIVGRVPVRSCTTDVTAFTTRSTASTFAARVIASTGADLASCVGGALGALAGPLHGGPPTRMLEMLDEIGTPGRAEEWVRERIARSDRIMGFSHAVYAPRTRDPGSSAMSPVACAPRGWPANEWTSP